MTTLRVTSCADCPLAKDGEMGDWCALDKEQRDLPLNTRPDWCPLSAGPVEVKVSTAGGVVCGQPAMTIRGRLKKACDGCPTVRDCYSVNQCVGAPGTERDLFAPAPAGNLPKETDQ